jgi:hypothetical protein
MLRVSNVKSLIRFKSSNLFCFVLILFVIFAISGGCKDKTKGKAEDTTWQKIRIVTSAGQALEIRNPEIDYSSPDGDAEDDESFGIRVQDKDDMTIVPWDSIKNIDITPDNKRLLATITTRDGKPLEAILIEDSTKGLSGLSGSSEVTFHLRELQKIEVIR